MRAIILPVFIVMLGALSGCEDKEADQAIAPELKAKAADMCKHDKGVRQLIDAYGTSFTAQCKSGIIVAGIVNL